MEDYRQQLADFIEVLNRVLAKDEYEAITLDGDRIFSDEWSGDSTNGYILSGRQGEEPIHEEFWDLEQVGISTREQLLDLCTDILRRKVGEALMFSEYSSYMTDLERYIQDFAKKLKDEWECFRDVSLFNLPIRITPCDTLTEDGETDICTKGTASDQLISVFGVDPERRDEDQADCRHETIHFMLFKALLDGSDDSCIFWFFADLYDAKPYKEMNETNSAVYEEVREAYREGKKEKVEEWLRQMKDKMIHNIDLPHKVGNRSDDPGSRGPGNR